MREQTALILGGILSLCMAVLGSVTSWSAVQSGGTDGIAYFVVTAGLCALGISLLVLGWRRRRRERSTTSDEDDDRSSTSSHEPRRHAVREGVS